MELLNSAPTTPINIVSNQLTNTRESTLLDNRAIMEANNLTQSAAGEVATVTASSDETTSVIQPFIERNLELKLPILSSSSSDSEPEEATNPAAGTSAGIDGERAASPPPNCAICLGRCKNKCFTDSCMHQFCFKCLCEWSKVKPECPLCKQTFKSIIHNVKSIHQFEEYHVQPPTVQLAHPPFEMDFQEMRIFGVVHPGHNRNHAWNEANQRPFYYGDFSTTSPYSTTSNGNSLPTASGSSSNRTAATNSSGLRNQYVYRELLDLYRQEYPGAIANSGTLSQLWRRYVYDRKLYAMPVADITGRFRESNARFYRDNPSQIHRLMPWINRDIVCLLRQTQHDVTTVLESINSALTLMNILSPAFRRRLQPFLGTKTAHFIHELNNFARSPYDMIGYDRAVQYLPQTNGEEIVIEFTSSDESSDNEQIDVAGDGGNTNTTSTSRSRSANASSINAINLTIHNRLTSAATHAAASRLGASNQNEAVDDISLVIDLRGESDNNESTSTAQATTNSSNYQYNQNVAASESDMVTSAVQPTVSENIELTSGSSDECEFVLERKPPHLRTPEMVSLDSASDSDVVFIDESVPLNKTSFSSSEGELNEGPSGSKHPRRHHNKIAALVETKKRNQAANLVKSEHQDFHRDVYNLGASTSAALRLSLQKQVEKSHRTDGSGNCKRLRHEKYSLRSSNSQSRVDRQVHKRRGKRLHTESSHSSTSSSTTTSSSSSTTTSTNSSSSSSDEDYVASTSQRKNTSTAGGELATPKLGRRTRKTEKRKVNKNRNRGTAKRDTIKRKDDYSTDDDDDNDRHMGKNLALVRAINERRKREKQKNRTKVPEDEDESDVENSWRLKAVNEPLRKQQQQRNKNTNKTSERKSKRKQSFGIDSNSGKRQKCGTQTDQLVEIQKALNCLNSESTSSDESDNINLVQLKSKLIGQECSNVLRVEQTNTNQETEKTTNLETTINNDNTSENHHAASTASSLATGTLTTVPSTYTGCPSIPTAATTDITETSINSPATNYQLAENTTVGTANEVALSVGQNDLFHLSDDSIDNMQNIAEGDRNDNNSQENYQQNRQPSSSLNIDGNANHNHDDDGAEGDLCDYDDSFRNVATALNLNEANAFADGASISTTTTDTILHEAAEQISSSAVNFYNPQHVFNTADFADENSTNSSSSDSSISSSTTSLSSSSNSSSNNSNNYLNYHHS